MLSAVPDHGTAVAATQIASSRLVVATETAQSAAQGLVAFQERGPSSQQLAGSLAAVTGQRLVRTICRSCRTDAEPPAAQTLSAHGISDSEAGTLSFYRGQGCPACNHVGYRGRRAIFEVLPGAPEVRGAVSNGLSASEVEAMATAVGMTPIRDRCLHLVREGVTTFDEFSRLRL
jgi:type II secretory ATPase GspE/PulE/Tfp pilus assembly ATPase PilB-like protein